MKSLTERLQVALNEDITGIADEVCEYLTECETVKEIQNTFMSIAVGVQDALGTFEMLAEEDEDKKVLFNELEKLAKKHKLDK